MARDEQRRLYGGTTRDGTKLLAVLAAPQLVERVGDLLNLLFGRTVGMDGQIEGIAAATAHRDVAGRSDAAPGGHVHQHLALMHIGHAACEVLDATGEVVRCGPGDRPAAATGRWEARHRRT